MEPDTGYRTDKKLINTKKLMPRLKYREFENEFGIFRHVNELLIANPVNLATNS